jgi:hypothetical protein
LLLEQQQDDHSACYTTKRRHIRYEKTTLCSALQEANEEAAATYGLHKSLGYSRPVHAAVSGAADNDSTVASRIYMQNKLTDIHRTRNASSTAQIQHACMWLLEQELKQHGRDPTALLTSSPSSP